MTQESPGSRVEPTRHSLFEDVQAMALGTLFLAFGVVLYRETGLLTGGVAGTSLILDFTTPITFSAAFFLLNLPFYALAFIRMGLSFTLRTFVAVGLISLLARLIPFGFEVSFLSPALAAVLGGAMMGVGLVMLLRHRAGIGGISILGQFLQDRGLARAGYVQLAVDLVILLVACLILPADKVALSLVGALVLNLTVAVNHKPGRYRGMS